MDDLRDGEGEEAGGHVVEHDAGAGGEAFELADGGWFEDVKEAEEEEREDGVCPVGRAEDEGDELAGYLVDDDLAGVFAAGLAGDDGGGGDADQRDDDGSDGSVEREVCGMKGLGGCQPENERGDATVGSGAGLEQPRSEEGADGPGPEGLLFGRWMNLDGGVGHLRSGVQCKRWPPPYESASKSSIQRG